MAARLDLLHISSVSQTSSPADPKPPAGSARTAGRLCKRQLNHHQPRIAVLLIVLTSKSALNWPSMAWNTQKRRRPFGGRYFAAIEALRQAPNSACQIGLRSALGDESIRRQTLDMIQAAGKRLRFSLPQ